MVADAVPTVVSREITEALYFMQCEPQRILNRSDDIRFACHSNHDVKPMKDAWREQIRGIILHGSLAALDLISGKGVGLRKHPPQRWPHKLPDVRGEQHAGDGGDGREGVTS